MHPPPVHSLQQDQGAHLRHPRPGGVARDQCRLITQVDAATHRYRWRGDQPEFRAGAGRTRQLQSLQLAEQLHLFAAPVVREEAGPVPPSLTAQGLPFRKPRDDHTSERPRLERGHPRIGRFHQHVRWTNWPEEYQEQRCVG
jgi:hypothetical protein